MSFRSSVTIVASPRPRVGKTLLARLLTDFHRHEGRRVAAFDLNGGEDTLARYLPMQASAASVADVRGEMALFDRLIADDGVSKVVDLGAESFATFFSVAAKIGFAEEARRRAVAPAVLFVMTPDRTAVEAYRHLHGRFPAVMLMPVHNEILGPAHHPGKYLFVGSGAQVVQSKFRRSPWRTRSSATGMEFPPARKPSCNAGCAASFSSSASSNCASCWPTCNPRSSLARTSVNFKRTRPGKNHRPTRSSAPAGTGTRFARSSLRITRATPVSEEALPCGFRCLPSSSAVPSVLPSAP
jgi:hypothetical protein